MRSQNHRRRDDDESSGSESNSWQSAGSAGSGVSKEDRARLTRLAHPKVLDEREKKERERAEAAAKEDFKKKSDAEFDLSNLIALAGVKETEIQKTKQEDAVAKQARKEAEERQARQAAQLEEQKAREEARNLLKARMAREKAMMAQGSSKPAPPKYAESFTRKLKTDAPASPAKPQQSPTRKPEESKPSPPPEAKPAGVRKEPASGTSPSKPSPQPAEKPASAPEPKPQIPKKEPKDKYEAELFAYEDRYLAFEILAKSKATLGYNDIPWPEKGEDVFFYIDEQTRSMSPEDRRKVVREWSRRWHPDTWAKYLVDDGEVDRILDRVLIISQKINSRLTKK